MVATGMRDAGYVCVNIDDTWEGECSESRVLQPNAKFGNMSALAAYVHARSARPLAPHRYIAQQRITGS
jgi:alpha-galactosidase